MTEETDRDWAMLYTMKVNEIAALQAEVERLKRMNADQDSLLDTRTDELEAAEAKVETL